jgi:hypothetical protein
MTLRPSALRSMPAAATLAGSDSLMPSIHSTVSTRRAVRCQSTCGTRKSSSVAVFSAISEMAAPSSRKSISSSVEAFSVSTTATGFKRRDGVCQRSIWRAAK